LRFRAPLWFVQCWLLAEYVLESIWLGLGPPKVHGEDDAAYSFAFAPSAGMLPADALRR
jgi:hypothetical protein